MPEFPFTYPLETGKCYAFTGSGLNFAPGESVAIELGDGTTYDAIGSITGVGGVTFTFTYDGDPEYTYVRLTYVGRPIVGNFAINLQAQCADKICSECFRVTDCEPPHREHLFIEYRNNEDGLGFNYSNQQFNPNFYVIAGLRNADYEYDEEVFLTSNQERYRNYTAATKTKELWIHDIPEYMHDAMRIALVHDEFYINGERYVKAEGSYSPDWDTPNSMLAPCVVRVIPYDQNTVNDNCG